jgi:bifunctional non-homologous end joining protein LigD
MSRKKDVITVGRRRIEVSNLDKVMYPATGFTKGDVIRYYRDIAPVLLAHLKSRPVTLKRYPDGVEGNFFYEKRCPPHRPDWIKTLRIRRKRDNKEIDYCLLDDQASLVWAANLANIELHTSLGRGPNIFKPSYIVFDLDPGPRADVVDCGWVALKIRDLLTDFGLESLVKTSGSKGLQLYVPLNLKVSYEETSPFALSVAQRLEAEYPRRVVSKMSKELRTGRIFIDWSQNHPTKTTASVYSLRARERPTVSTPITWDELEASIVEKDPSSLAFGPDEVLRRVEKSGDLFSDARTIRQTLPREKTA